MALRPWKSSALASKIAIKLRTVTPGDDTGCDTVASTGQIDSSPAKGSRKIPLKNEDAAPLGLPGRTLTVIKRALRPSINPLRL